MVSITVSVVVINLVHKVWGEQAPTSLEELATAILRLPASCPVSEAIDRFQEAHQELALVEEEGRVVGLLTVTDAFEAIAGELDDPFD